MKIALVVGTFYPELGGMGQVVYDEAKALARLGNAVTVFTMRYQGFIAEQTLDGFLIKRITPLIKIGDAGLVRGLAVELKAYDIIHLHWPWFGGAEEVLRAKQRYQKKYFLTYHMEATPTGLLKTGLKRIYDWYYSGKILANAEMVAVVDEEYFKVTAWSKRLTKKWIELSNPVDLNVFKKMDATWSEFGLQELTGKQVALFVGNLIPLKRLDLVFAAMKILNNGLELVVAGGGYELEHYQTLAQQAGLVNRVHFVGRITDRVKLARLYNLVGCLVVPSDTESFSLTALEALAIGVPVVGSANLGLTGRITDGKDGFLFRPGSPKALAEALTKVFALSAEERNRFAKFGNEQVKIKYSLDLHASKLVEFYHAI